MAAVESSRCLILFAHGARDPRWADPLTRLRELLLARVDAAVEVHHAFLELMTPTLPELTSILAARGVKEMVVVPIFLGQGAHVRDELPQLISQLQSNYPAIDFSLAPPIGENEQVLLAIADACIGSL